MSNTKKQDKTRLVLALGRAINWRDWAETQECHECGTSQGCEDEHATELAEWTKEVNKAEKALIAAHGQDFHDSIRKALDQGAVDNEGYWVDSPHAEHVKRWLRYDFDFGWTDAVAIDCKMEPNFDAYEEGAALYWGWHNGTITAECMSCGAAHEVELDQVIHCTAGGCEDDLDGLFPMDGLYPSLVRSPFVQNGFLRQRNRIAFTTSTITDEIERWCGRNGVNLIIDGVEIEPRQEKEFYFPK